VKDESLDHIEDILDAMDKAEILVQGYSFEQFEADFRTNFAVVRALEIIGEATKRLPMDLREEYPEVPWKEMAGTRDRIIHGYDNVNLRLVWDTVTQRIPAVRPLIQRIMAESSG
jgi:uncharacterized protein with HEPN domain